MRINVSIWTLVKLLIGLSVLGAALLVGFWVLGRGISRGLDAKISGWSAELGRNLPSATGGETKRPESEKDLALVGLAALEERVIGAAVVEFYHEKKALPRNLAEARPPSGSWETEYPMKRALMTDPWGQPYVLQDMGGCRFLILSEGPPASQTNANTSSLQLPEMKAGDVFRVGNRIVLLGAVPC